MCPLLVKCLFYRHYITFYPAFVSPCTPSNVSVYSQDIISLLPLHSYLDVPICKCLFSGHYITSPFIPIYMYPFRTGKSSFSRHYITSTPPFQSICNPSLVNICLQDITLPLPFHSNRYVRLLGWCLFFKHYVKFTPPFQSICTLSWEKTISKYPLLGTCLFSRHYIAFILHSICTPSWINVYSQDIISPLPLHSNLYVPPLC